MFSIQRFWLILGFSFLTLPGVFASEVRAQTLEVVSLDPVAETTQSSSGENAAGQVFAEFSSPGESAAERTLANRPSSGANTTGQIFADLSQIDRMWEIATDIAPSPQSQQALYGGAGSPQTTVSGRSPFAFSDVSREGYLLLGKNFSEEERDRFPEPLGALVADRRLRGSAPSHALELAIVNPDFATSQTPEAKTTGKEAKINPTASQTPETQMTGAETKINPTASQTPETQMTGAETTTNQTSEAGTTGAEPTPSDNRAPESDRSTAGDKSVPNPHSEPSEQSPFSEPHPLPEPITVPEPSVSLFAWLGVAVAGLMATKVRSKR